jgi:protein-S-isoprenylcysteine O-methyltransferase Ste14
MPRLALALCLLWFVSLFVFRTMVQWKRTGSTGIKSFHGRVGSLPWLAGVMAMLGLVMALLTPVASLQGWRVGTILVNSSLVHWIGAVLTVLGIAGGLWAQLNMGSSWRIGVDQGETTQLVTTGLFGWVRNPIFSFIGLSVFGFVMLVPSPCALLAAFATWLGIEAQVRAVEEPYLMRIHGETYAHYASSVGRFVPGLGQMSAN